jgi:hypothetical protein
MAKYSAWELYEGVTGNAQVYKETVHCPMIIELMEAGYSIAGFCTDAGISEKTFYKWLRAHPVFKECFEIGYTIAKHNWEQELEESDDEFNHDLWKARGFSRKFLGKNNNVRLTMESESNPYEQYQQLIEQANDGDFTASELKQLMEGINVGRVSYETFVLQGEIDKMKKDLVEMEVSNEHNIIPIAPVTKTN